MFGRPGISVSSCRAVTIAGLVLLLGAQACSSRVPSDEDITERDPDGHDDWSGESDDNQTSGGDQTSDNDQTSGDDQTSDDQTSDDQTSDDQTSDDDVTVDDNCTLPVDQSNLELPLWTLMVEDDAWAELHDHPYDDIEVSADVCIEGKLLPIGLEIQGASARRLDKKNYKLKFNRGTELEGSHFGTEHSIDKLILKAMAADRSKLREPLAFELWRQMGHHAPREGFLNLQVNGRYHGVYVLVEPVDKDYLRRRQIPDWGQMYKGVRKHGSFADFRPGRPLDAAFEDETNPDAPDFTPLRHLVELIQNQQLQGEEFADALSKQLSISDYIDRMIWISFTQNGDAVAQNFFLYQIERDNEPAWQFIPWDSNLCFGEDWRNAETLVSFEHGLQLGGGNLLAERILEIDGLRAQFKERYLELLDTLFEPKYAVEVFESFARLVQHDMRYDQERWQYPTDAESGLGAVREFLKVRSGYVRDALDNF